MSENEGVNGKEESAAEAAVLSESGLIAPLLDNVTTEDAPVFWAMSFLHKHVIGIGKKEFDFNDNDQEAAEQLIRALKQKLKNGKADIYEVCSVIVGQDSVFFLKSYLFWKCWICHLIQTVVVPLVAVSQAYHFFRKAMRGQYNLCQMNASVDDIIGKFVAFCFCLYVLVRFAKNNRDLNAQDNAATFLIVEKNKIVNCVGTTYIWGYADNITSEYLTSLAAVLVIYAAGTPMDIVLNSLAIFFVNEIDDVLASQVEVDMAMKVLDRMSNEDLHELGYVGDLFFPCKWSGIFMTLVTFCVLMLAPFFMVACYGIDGKND